jgi:predicted nucleic acid-binding protein
VEQEDIAELVALLREQGMEVTVTRSVQLCRDPDDDVILETAFLGNADAVVSRDEDLKGDEDLASVLQTAGIEVLSVRRFLLAFEEVDG